MQSKHNSSLEFLDITNVQAHIAYYTLQTIAQEQRALTMLDATDGLPIVRLLSSFHSPFNCTDAQNTYDLSIFAQHPSFNQTYKEEPFEFFTKVPQVIKSLSHWNSCCGSIATEISERCTFALRELTVGK